MAELVNGMRRKLESGAAVVGTILSMPSPAMAQLLAGAGLDFLMIDMEHGAIGRDALQPLIAATAVADCVPIVRVPWTVPWTVKPPLDAGALGIVFPMVTTAAMAAEAVASCRYPTAGERGWGPFYAPSRWGVSAMEYTAGADREILKIALIEHIEAVRNIDAILATDGLDAAFIAPYDLSASLGAAGDFEAASYREAYARAEGAVLGSRLWAGALALTAEQANAQIAKGYRLIILGYDTLLVERTMRGLLEPIRRRP
jgi:4-hydroxy-2-oxoheptanedioate aldolase